MHLLKRIGSRAALLTALLALGSCARNVSPPGVFFASEPPGARIMVDGLDSGYVTPRMIAFNKEEQYRISVEMQGFHAHELVLLPSHRGYWVAWDEGAVTMHGLLFPLFLALGDVDL